MKRLRDTEGGDPSFRHGVELLQATPPTEELEDVKLRVWRRLNGRVTVRRDVPTLLVKLAMAAIVALAAGTAGAVIVRRLMVPEPAAVVPPSRSNVAPPRIEKKHPIEPIVGAADTVVEIPSPRPSPKTTARSASKKLATPAAPSAAAVARERTEVLDALVALRREHDPVRAGTLLARYLAAHPQGALREEALALAIEAADARADRAGGEQLAQAYQSEFPAGRFLPFARSHIDHRPGH